MDNDDEVGLLAGDVPRQNELERERARAVITVLGWHTVKCWIRVHRSIVTYHVLLALLLLSTIMHGKCRYLTTWASVYLFFGVPAYLCLQFVSTVQAAALHASRDFGCFTRPTTTRLLFWCNRVLNVFQAAWHLAQGVWLLYESGVREPIPAEELCSTINPGLFRVVVVSFFINLFYILTLSSLLGWGALLSTCYLYIVGVAPRQEEVMTGVTPEDLAAASTLVTFSAASSPILESDRVCVICMEDYADEDRLRFLGCKHHFHVDCIDEWLSISVVCPFCRGEATATPHEDCEPMPSALEVPVPTVPLPSESVSTDPVSTVHGLSEPVSTAPNDTMAVSNHVVQTQTTIQPTVESAVSPAPDVPSLDPRFV